MKNRKRMLVVFLIIFLVLLVFCSHIWNQLFFQKSKIEILCEASIYSAQEHFEEYDIAGKDSDYTAGVAEFRTYMRAYLVLIGQRNVNYTWCDNLYNNMILHPEQVKTHSSELVEALEYLAEDYDHPNGFHLINTINNQLNCLQDPVSDQKTYTRRGL